MECGKEMVGRILPIHELMMIGTINQFQDTRHRDIGRDGKEPTSPSCFPVHILHVIQQKPLLPEADIGLHLPGEIDLARMITGFEDPTDEGDTRMSRALKVKGHLLDKRVHTMIGMNEEIQDTALTYNFQERLFFGLTLQSEQLNLPRLYLLP
jgi:hypothetical protein